MCDYIFLDDKIPALTVRKNKDKEVNNNGRQLLDLCKTTNIIIVNRRMGSDRNIGEHTRLNYNGRKLWIRWLSIIHCLIKSVISKLSVSTPVCRTCTAL